MTLQDEYEKLVAIGKVKDDLIQRQVLANLEKLKCDIERYFATRKLGLKKILPFPKSHGLRGLYIYGSVGRGKSMLMDLFYAKLTISKKKRVHFHAFMLEIHARLHKWRKENKDNYNAGDPIPDIAKDISKKINILCFDEFQVTDIADAMILGRLFTELFRNKLIIVATSNRSPDDLYKDGLQRERFLPFIDMLREQLDIVELSESKDYRLIHFKLPEKLYYYPLGKNADIFIQKAFAELTFNGIPQPSTIESGSRKLTMSKVCRDIAWVSFDELCKQPLGAADYIAIANEFSAVLIDGIPQMTKENRNEAKRFVTLIDELYEHKVKLIITAEVPPAKLYVEGDGSFEFERTISRLTEMQSEQYLLQGHITNKTRIADPNS